MPPGWLHELALGWMAVCIAAAILIGLDLVRHPQRMAIMNAVWPITALYLGPVAIWAYGSFGQPRGAARPLAQASFLGASHCGAGCTLGDLLGEWLVFLTGLMLAGSVLWADCLADFVFAWTIGIAFQYLSIAPMRGLGLRAGVIAAIKADTVSIIAFEAGMFAWMALSHLVLFPRLEPDHLVYWFMMQVAMMVGFLTTMPANALLVRAGLKEAM